MPDLYGQLKRVFMEVNPLVRTARKGRKRKFDGPGLFAEPSEKHWVQVWPGVFDERPNVWRTERPCIYFVDAGDTIVLPGTTADFTEVVFKYPVYQIPLWVGHEGEINLEGSYVEQANRNLRLGLFKELDGELQQLILTIRDLVGSGLTAELVHETVEKLRVWEIDDYGKPAFWKTIAMAVREVSDALYSTNVKSDKIETAKQEVAAVRKALKVVEGGMKSKIDSQGLVLESILSCLDESIARKPFTQELKAYLQNPITSRNDLVQQESARLSNIDDWAEKSLVNGLVWVNNAYLRLVSTQMNH